MSISKKKWIISPYDSQLQLKISQELKISPVLAQLCINRGLNTSEDIEKFIQVNPSEINSPFTFRDMDQAVILIEETIKSQEKILIYGDYDVDGITATSLLYLYLKGKTKGVSYYIPDRSEEGYGLNEKAIHLAHQEGYKLIITVDCGISALVEAQIVKSLGLKLIITDHHTPPEQLPEAAAIINPKMKESGYPFPGLAGVGVAWKLAQALAISSGINDNGETTILDEYLDLVALGTVADVVPLIGENRVIVAAGLSKITKALRPGIKALLSVTGLANKPITSGQVGYIIAPRLNAVGRLSQARFAVELLTGLEYPECLTRANELEQMNSKRQEVEGEIFQQALKMIEENVDLAEDFVIVLASENWHPGVIGIVSSRLVEKFYRPVVLFAIEGETAKGSARSMEQFDIYLAFSQCQDFLIQFGGHKLAAGIKLYTKKLDDFRRAINDYANGVINRDNIVHGVKIDLELDANGLESVYIEDSEKLSPYGSGNAQPIFVYRNLRIIEAKAVGSMQSHLKLKFDAGEYCLEGIGFNLSHHLSWLNTYARVDVAVALENNQWNGCKRVQLIIRDIQPYQELSVLESGPSKAISHIVDQSLVSESFADFREIENREAYLINLLKSKEPCLIYVSSRQKGEELSKLVTGSFMSEDHISVCHSQQRPWQHEYVMAKIKSKLSNILIVTGQLYADAQGLFKHVVFFHSPRNMGDFFRLTGLDSSINCPKIHLLFNRQDIEILDHDFKTGFPDRELLGKIYKSVRRLASSTNQIFGSREEIMGKMMIEGLDKGKERAFDAWLSIMMELELLRLSVQGNRYCLELINNGNKCDLEDSLCYSKGLREKKAFDLWNGIALSPDLNEKIFAMLG